MQQWHNPIHCPFGVDTTTEAKNITTSDNNGIWRCMSRLEVCRHCLSDVVVTFLSSIVALTPNGNFLIVPVLHSWQFTGCCREETWTIQAPNIPYKSSVTSVFSKSQVNNSPCRWSVFQADYSDWATTCLKTVWTLGSFVQIPFWAQKHATIYFTFFR